METTELAQKTDWMKLVSNLGKDFEKRASIHDVEGKFVFDNYEQLRAHKFFSAGSR